MSQYDDLSVREIARRLADRVESFCAEWLAEGRRIGNYWECGSLEGEEGQSMKVHLAGGRAGKWTDYATGEHGDLLDIIEQQRRVTTREAVQEAKDWLGIIDTRPATKTQLRVRSSDNASGSSPESARRLWHLGKPIEGTPAEVYLRGRAITEWGPNLRYLARTFYVGPKNERLELPALLCAITDNAGTVTGVNRIYLTPEGTIADVSDPKKVLGHIAQTVDDRFVSGAVRVGTPGDVLLVGEGVETMLSLKTAAPHLPIAAALTATHLTMFEPPEGLRQLWIARDSGEAGEKAALALKDRLMDERPELSFGDLKPRSGDFNNRLSTMGAHRLAKRMRKIMGEAWDGILPAR